ncbi:MULTISPECIES: LysR family transcriptional regulator [Pseudomonas]|jgi:LysR family glycine cleavage system transcriptional activator|uniref:LysR family transcriptional regulator n=1 Tax=Pseudomonas syringae TaxID=317 RepID=A0A085V9Y6_PSESX|nr:MULTISPECIES: LysR family transcriptional regulator [Pseudomonas]EPJ80124.1 transcriptional regulator, LysR family protein [Pseudomonas sp. CFII64]KFE52249.1 LysR family transcriptional regulator [Pseudomonas syringae]
MVKHIDPDNILLQMPSLKAVKSFVAAAKYQSFTRAAEALCVTQAAISRQIRELEAYLGVDLFRRVGRAVELTEAGSAFFDAAQLSFVNISQAARRVRLHKAGKSELTLCCSPAFSALWLSPKLPGFFSENQDIDLNLISTQNFLSMEPGVTPDIFITKFASFKSGYRSYPLFHDVIYPVCTPQYRDDHPELATLEGLRDGALLNLNPYGRSQVAEHIDWGVWLAFHDTDIEKRPHDRPHVFSANDYNVVINMTLAHQGVALGWSQLVAQLIESGALVRPLPHEVVHKDSQHYLAFKEDRETDQACCKLRDWLLSQFA